MAKLEIQIQITELVKPSTPTPDHLRSLKLSFFDQTNLRSGYVPVLLYYLPSPNSRAEKLKKSLADTLAKFYPLAGRFNKDDLSVNCNDEGVEYVETKVNADLAAFLLHEDGPKIEPLNDLLPWEVFPKDGPLLGVQVNLFNCGGLVIGMQISHIPADAFTIVTFINEWASCSSLKTGITKSCTANFGLLSLLYPPLALPQKEQPTDGGGAKFVIRRFVFDALAIAKLKDTIDSSSTSMKPSRVVVVTSLIWKVLVGISSATHGHSRDSCALIAVNLRKRTNISSLEHALGNFSYTAIASLAAANKSRKEFNDFVSLVGSTSRDAFVNFGKENPADLFDMFKVLQKNALDFYAFSSWSRFPFYEADFGWGKPFWVSIAVRKAAGEGVILLDTNDGEGIEAWLSLKEKHMAAFERDPDILAFCPSGKLQLITQVG